MKQIDDFIQKIANDSRCDIFTGRDKLQILEGRDLKYPDDIIYFYEKCNGVRLFKSGHDNVSFTILPPSHILQANKIKKDEILYLVFFCLLCFNNRFHLEPVQ